MKAKILIILIILIGLGIGGFFVWRDISVPAPIEVSNTTRAGILEREEIWSGQINITGDILVEEGVTLTILPGTQVIISANKDIRNLFGHWECDGIENYDLLIGTKEEDNTNCGIHRDEPYRDEAHHISLIIKGTLRAVGAEENKIIFKSDSLKPTIYDWNRLEIYNGILSYANIENYRILGTNGDDVEISHNNLKNIGECGICANSKAKIFFNTISYAGHELIDMHNNSPIIHNNKLGPNPNQPCIVIDGGLPQIVGNTIKSCGSGILMLKPPDDPTFEKNVLQNNTFIGNNNSIWYTY